MSGAASTDYPPPPVPSRPSKRKLHDAIARCRACDLYVDATQPVLGEGPLKARIVMVGETPGDREDVQGRPFVGPAGRVLDDGLDAVGLRRDELYLTNAVKHFRFRQRGKRRIHQTPDRWHATACLPWLDAELELVRPDAVVLLGLVAAQSVLGPSVRIGRDRGRPVDSDVAKLVVITTHPSAILRVDTRAERDAAMAAFVSDLRIVVDWLAAP
jgi:DNA polymerase